MRNYRLLATAWCGAALLTFSVTLNQANAEDSARAVTYQHDGQTFYALSLLPEEDVKQNDAASVVVLFDTSASQQGAYREAALAALDSMLANLRTSDRVELLAVDLGAQPMTESPVAPGSAELRVAVKKLRQQVPLGSTDLAAALQAATKHLDDSKSQNRSIVYIGDGISIANLLDSLTLEQVLGGLRQSRTSVTSYVIGPKTDAQLLAVLANHTGGNLYLQPEMVWSDETAGVSDQRAQAENLRNAQIAGKQLADWTAAAVYWPKSVDYAMELGRTYPAVMPPLRSDRDTILVGSTSDALSQPVQLRVEAEGPQGSVTLNWTTQPEPSQDDHAFLAEIIDVAQADDGLSLPTVGSAGLAEAARLVGARMDQLTRLAQRAISVGDHQAAHRIAQAVLRADPGNAQARTVQHVVAQADPDDPFGDLSIPEAAVEADAPPEIIVPVEQGVVVLQGNATVPVVDNSLLGEVARDGVFLDQVEQERRVFAEMLSKEIQNTVLEARERMSSDPQRVIQDLKIALEGVARASDLSAGKRAELTDKLQVALKEARYQATLKDELDRQREEELASSQARQLLHERLTRKIEREKQLMARFNALVDEKRYLEAEEVAQIVEEVDPNGVTPRVATLWSRHKRAHYLRQVARTARHKAFFDTMYQVELSHIPMPDTPPIIYPDAAEWEELTNRRRKYASVDLSARSKSEERIQSILREPLKAPLQHDETPLIEIIEQLQEEYDIPIQIDEAALDQLAISPETEVTVNLRNVSLKSALNLMLKKPGLEDLTYVLDQEVLLITTTEKANENLKVKVYPVADLVLPIINLGGIGGGGGGLGGGGGGQGGGGGGFGGGGGGGFGGGGGGGGQGGGGGGFFNVADDADTDSTPKAKAQAALTSTGSSDQAPSSGAPGLSTDKPSTDWSQRFQQEHVDAAEVRTQAKRLLRQGQPEQVVALIQAALKNGQSQPWMYESLGIAMELAGQPKSEIERAIMSACDFSNSPDELMLIAQYLSHADLDNRALDVYRQIIKIAPLHYEAYALGLRAAQRTENLDGIRWATIGILEHDWPQAQQKIQNIATRVAKATLDQLQTSGSESAHKIYQRQLDQAMVRDVVVKVSWSGDADVDLIVEEPSGTTCSLHEPRSSGGGVCLGDSYTDFEKQKAQGLSEEYRCAKGFPGTYRVRVRKVWGELVAGKVAVDVYKNYGTKNELHERQHIAVSDESDAMVVFEVEQSRREKPLQNEQLAVAVRRQQAISKAVLAQQFGGFSDPTITPVRGGDGNDLRRRLALAGQGGAVGFRPIIQVLNDGTQLLATAVVSADRRYVRITAAPQFTGIGNVSTFTFSGSAEQLGDIAGGAGGGAGAGGGGGGGI